MQERPIPTWLQLAYTAWIVIWVPAYWLHNGPTNFLWLCDVANLMILPALWLQSPLLISSQAVAVLLVQAAWAIDFLGALLIGSHPIGGTEYMFDAAQPLAVRALSLFHLAMPPLLLWGVWRLGFDRRGWKLQTLITWVLLPVSYLWTDPELNINWIWRPFNQPQKLLPPGVYLIFCMAAFPLVLYLPTHHLLKRWMEARGRPTLPRD